MTTNTDTNKLLSYNIASINLNNISNTNKINSLKTFVKLVELDVILFQEVENENLELYGFDIVYNIDHEKRGTAIAVKSHITCSEVERSLDSRVIKLRLNNDVIICNVYAPSGSANRSSREHFFNETLPYYLRNSSDLIILGGDFNCIEKSKDSSNENTSNFSPMLKRLRQALCLNDAWEVLFGNKQEYSFIRGGFGSRIDRIYVSNSLSKNIVDAKYQVSSFTDHKAFIVKIQLPYLGRGFGKGVWNYKPLILEDERNRVEFQQKWQYWASQRRYYRNWLVWWTEYAKPKVISFLKWKSSTIYKDFHSNMEFWYFALRRAYDDYLIDTQKIAEINRIKGKMLKLQRDFSAFLSRNNEIYFSGEPMSIFQLDEKFKKRNKTQIKTIEVGGRQEYRAEVIQEHIVDHFESFFKSSPIEDGRDFRPEKVLAPGNIHNENLMNAATEDEVYHAIKNSASKKAPGLDGLPKEFFMNSWGIIKTEITAIVNCAIDGNMEKKFCDGMIVLVRKKNANNKIEGYRPLTLLNFDYKIVTRIMKERLNKLMPDLISSNQKCANPRRNIFEVTCSIRDRITELQYKKKRALLVSFDMEKAFDRVEPRFLFDTLQAMNVNKKFIDFMKAARDVSYSKILVNGRLSREIKVDRSVRQGDPISMHLFVLYLEPLLQKIIASCSDELDLVNAYADDVSLVINNLNDLEIIKQLFIDYGKVSGAQLNLNKTKAIEIGFGPSISLISDWLNITSSIKILGIQYSNSIRQMTDENWKNVIQNVSVVLQINQPRKLNLIQKQIFVNTFALSRAWYVASVIKLNNKYCAKLKSMIGIFLWQNHGMRISFNQLTLPRKSGGLGLHDPESKCWSLIINTFVTCEYDKSFIVNQFLNQQSVTIPASFDFVRFLKSELHSIPQQLMDRFSCKLLYDHYISNKQPAEISLKYPNKSWNFIWRNISMSRVINSEEKSIYYLMANEKIPNMDSFFRHGRSSNNLCRHCNVMIETLSHLFSECCSVNLMWAICLENLKKINPRKINSQSFDKFQFPELKEFSQAEREKIVLVFSKYIQYVYSTAPPNRSRNILVEILN